MPTSGTPLVEQVLRVITPAALPSGSTHNYNPTDATTGKALTEAEVIRQATNAAGSTVTGLAVLASGHYCMIVNLGPGTLTLPDGSGSSTAPFAFPNNNSVVLAVDEVLSVWYDGTSGVWRPAESEGTLLAGGVGTANTLSKFTSSSTIGNSSITDDGTTITASNPMIVTKATQASERLRFAGQEFYQAAHTDTDGPVLLLGVNRAANRQVWLAESSALAQNSTNRVLRLGVGSVLSDADISAMATDGVTAKTLNIQGSGGLTAIGGALTVAGNTTLGDTTSDNTVINGSLHQINLSGSAGVVIGTTSKDWTFYMSGTSLVLHEYTGTMGGGGGSDWVTFAAGGGTTLAGAVTVSGGLTISSNLTVNSGNAVTIGSAASFVNFNNTSFDGPILQTSEVAPAQITANQNDYSPTNMSRAVVLLVNSDAARDITGFATGVSGRWLWVYNTGAFNITLKHQVTSSAGNQIRGRGGADTVLTPSTGVQLYYSGSLTKWVVMTDTL